MQDAMDSVLSQSYDDLEYIIVDGASTDGTLESIQDVTKKYTEKSINFISEKDDGIYDAMNKGLQLVSGDVVGILNADDFYADSTVLEKLASAFADKKVNSCYGDLIVVDPENTNKVFRYWRAREFKPEKFYWGWMPPHPTFFVRREVYKQYGGFNLELGTAADYELMLRFLVKHRITTNYIPEVLVKMRMGGQSNATLYRRLVANRMDRKAWTVNGLKPYPWTLWMKPLCKIPQWWQRPKLFTET